MPTVSDMHLTVPTCVRNHRWAAAKIQGGHPDDKGAKGTFSLAGATNPDGTLTLKLDGTLELPITT